MDSDKVNYSGRTKEASNKDKLGANTTKAPTKYVFRPEVVKSMPKYSHSPSSDSKQSRRNSSNGLRGLFGRATRHTSENKSQERDIAERKRSRSLFLAHDHSKDNAKLTEHRAGRLDRRNNKHQSEAKCRKDQIDVRLRYSLDTERNNEQSRLLDNRIAILSKHRSSNDRSVERHGAAPEQLETCQEEYRENGELCCSTSGSKQCDDRRSNTTKTSENRWSQQGAAIDEDYGRTNKKHEEIVSRQCCLHHGRIKCSFDTENQRPKADSHMQQSRETNPYDSNERCRRENVRSLRRVDSPYPCVSNHINRLSPPRDVTSVEAMPGKLSTYRTTQDDSKSTISPEFRDSNTAIKTYKDCDSCGKPYLSSSKETNDRSIVEDMDRAMTESTVEKSGAKQIYDFEKKPGSSGAGGLPYRSRSLPQLSVHDSGVASGIEQIPGRPTSRLVADLRQLLTLKQHYYPEGGWGWVIVVVGVLVQIISHGIHGSAGVLVQQVQIRFESQVYLQTGWLGAMSTGVALLVSPVTIAFCRKKSTRVTAVLGGLVTALGCLFTSFASQFHQLFFSYGTVVGIGVGMTRDCSTLMVAQYFKRRREFVEIFIVSGSGLGIAVMSAFIKGAISKIGWRLGLQAVTGVVFITFILGTFYRSASLYHPQRRAILHLKNQKRKIKDKNRVDDRPPFFDFSTLKSKTVRILLISTGISAFGINTPIFYLAHQAEEEGLGDTVILLQTYLGLAWTLGCVAFGLLVVHHSVECRIARQYLTQAAVFMCGLCILALTAVHGNYHGYVMFTWIYGIFCGGYHYSLKMYTYERVRARNFAKTWGFVQCSQAIPIAIGVPISGYMNVGCGGKAGYYFSSTCVLVGSFTLFFIDLHRRNLSRHKHTRANGTRHLCVSDHCPQRRRLSFTQDPENEGAAAGAAAAALVLGAELAPGQGEMIDALGADKPELTCISEEGIADMDLPDNLLDDLDYIGDCITSCNKVENYLMLSEFENNLIAEMPIIMDRKGRRWSLARTKTAAQASPNGNGNENNGNNGNCQPTTIEDDEEMKLKWRLSPVPANNRVITVIDEAST